MSRRILTFRRVEDANTFVFNSIHNFYISKCSLEYFLRVRDCSLLFLEIEEMLSKTINQCSLHALAALFSIFAGAIILSFPIKNKIHNAMTDVLLLSECIPVGKSTAYY